MRDLLFHEKEHTFTIPEIDDLLKKIGLNFCGFENRNVLDLFTNVYNGENDRYNLKYWHEFEVMNPRIFASMYQFWCQKNL